MRSHTSSLLSIFFCAANGGSGGLALGPGSEANGANGHKGGVAIGPGSEANGGGVALNGGDTNGGGFALDGGQTHPGCNVAIGAKCLNQPGG